MGACGFVDPTGQAGGNKRHVDVREVMNGIMKDVPALESAGVVLRMPASWRMNHPARPQVKATVGGNAPSQLGMDALLDFRMEVTLEGESLSKAEIKRLLAHSDGLVLIRGKWVEVDHERLKRTLEQFEAIERRAAADGLSFGEAMRMLAGAGIAGDKTAAPADIDWSQTVAGPWLAETLATLRHPDWLTRVDPRQYVQGTLRPYQQSGVQWLYLLTQLKLGACLADDMGLGETIQVLSLLLVIKNEDRGNQKPCLLVAPASPNKSSTPGACFDLTQSRRVFQYETSKRGSLETSITFLFVRPLDCWICL
jgi:non-specific serine/threonine protein kinase